MDMTSDLSLQESCMAALRHMGVEVRALVGKTDELEAENAMLRELVDYMTPIALYAASEQERDRMRELGADA